MNLEGVIVCVDYADFLSHTLLFNKALFNKLVVVTSTKDKDTQKLCEFHYIQCVQTDCFYEGDNTFNKGKGINAGLQTLDRTDWVIHLDADIVLPPKTRVILESIQLDTRCLYGIDRMMCPDFESWLNFLRKPTLQHETEVFIHANAFPLGTRIMYQEGYLPLGFFQMWHLPTNPYQYPDYASNAGRSDLVFARQWPREHRHLLPELIAIHLETAAAQMGANWNGRTTPDFSLAEYLLKKKSNAKSKSTRARGTRCTRST